MVAQMRRTFEQFAEPRSMLDGRTLHDLGAAVTVRWALASVLAMATGLLLLVGAATPPAFETCRSLIDGDERLACYDRVADQQSAGPAKGATAPPLPGRP